MHFSSEVVSIDPREDEVLLQLSTVRPSTRSGWWPPMAPGAEFGGQLSIETDGPGDMGHFVNVMFRARYGQHLGDRRAILYQALSRSSFRSFRRGEWR